MQISHLDLGADRHSLHGLAAVWEPSISCRDPGKILLFARSGNVRQKGGMSANQAAGDGFKATATREKTTKMLQRRFNIAPMMEWAD
jgi:hypothetical protein